MLATLLASGMFLPTPCSHNEMGIAQEDFTKMPMFGEELQNVSNARYFKITNRLETTAAPKEWQSYLNDTLFMPSNKAFTEKLKHQFNPKTQILSELIISNYNILCVYNEYVYPVTTPNTHVWELATSETSVSAFAQSLEEFAENLDDASHAEGDEF